MGVLHGAMFTLILKYFRVKYDCVCSIRQTDDLVNGCSGAMFTLILKYFRAKYDIVYVPLKNCMHAPAHASYANALALYSSLYMLTYNNSLSLSLSYIHDRISSCQLKGKSTSRPS